MGERAGGRGKKVATIDWLFNFNRIFQPPDSFNLTFHHIPLL